MSGIIGDIVLGIIRHAVTAAAGGFVAKGIITSDQSTTMVAGVMVAVGVAFSVYDKYKKANP